MNSRIRILKDVLWIIAIAGLVAAVFRLWFGLGATTNLTDGVPWGFWKVFNMIAGVALSTSGFTVGFLAYVLKIKRFKPYVKPAVLIAFLGYGCSCAALLFDIGLPYRFWHPILMWNINSFLFEVFWCVMLYFTVTAIELAPVIFDGIKAERLSKAFHGIAIVAVIIGISLSSLHHSSLGSLFLVSPQRLHPLWYTPRLPLFFIISAMGAGIMFIVFVRIAWSYLYEPEPVFGDGKLESRNGFAGVHGLVSNIGAKRIPGPEMKTLTRLAMIGISLLALYLILKIADLAVRGELSLLWNNSPESWLFIMELATGALIPVLIMLLPGTKGRPIPVAMAGGSAAFGLVLNRLNVGIFGYFHGADGLYFPSLAEWALGLGVIAAAGLVFLAVTENFAIFDDKPAKLSLANLFSRTAGSIKHTWEVVMSDSLQRVSLIIVFILPLAFAMMYPPFFDSKSDTVRASLGIDVQRNVLKIDGDRNGFETIFAHAEHQKRLGDSASCIICHHVSVPQDRSTPCSRCHSRMLQASNIFDHDKHTLYVAQKENLTGWHPENRSCVKCHPENLPRQASTAVNCLECHRKDMYLPTQQNVEANLMYASSFCDAMHGTCLECHRKEAAKSDKKDLDKCYTCHKSLMKNTAETTIAAVSE